jgi:hypothetical protein
MFDTIVIGVDGEQGGRDAIALACNLAPSGTRLVLATIHGGDEHDATTVEKHADNGAAADELAEFSASLDLLILTRGPG